MKNPQSGTFWHFAKFLTYELTSREEAIAAACWYVHFGPAYSREVPTIQGYRGVRFGGGRPGYVCPDEASANFYARDIELDCASTMGRVSEKKFKDFESARAWAIAPLPPTSPGDGSAGKMDQNYVERPTSFPLPRDFSLKDSGGLRSLQRV